MIARWFGSWSILAIVLLGWMLRGVLWLRDPAVWHDESALIMNVLNLSFSEMLGPLLYYEAAPPAFLAVERAVALAWNDGTHALRLIPLLASGLSLTLFAHLAATRLPLRAAFWMVLLFATSDRLLWHSVEAKPYAIDTLNGVIVTMLGLAAIERRFVPACLTLALLAPMMLWLSFPSCFLFGGVMVAMLPRIWRERSQPGGWGRIAAYGTLVATVGISFLALYFGPIRAQRCDAMDSCWTQMFPNWSKPATIPFWTLVSTFEVVRYVAMPTGQILTILVGIGAVQLWRRGEAATVVLLLGPMALVLVAAAIHSYPYGCARVIVFLAPALLLLMGAALLPTQEFLARRHAWLPHLLTLLLLVPIGQGVWRTIDLWPRADTASAVEYVLLHREPGERVAVNQWDYDYYFRNLPNVMISWKGEPIDGDASIWLIVSGQPRPDTQMIDRWAGDTWEVVDRQQFEFTEVRRLVRKRPPSTTGESLLP
ncbi:hypothetical protein [Tuwongella immobilis]|uniref:Glycosyltransferase RgtA/B/C/D-like domain-containing protein n=1 Tax=Tuwongella immobilis TaxID=692036 RepID=A0A6C2YR33_9BACT|nr:hypothetical protein [Tuwongella immobilis]VIP03864.1 Uncharacterized protein OS=Chroococcidiopsis thermalis PCC 7203 GN=Chro_5069 PE=4 SV=1 [Tuwongella immobilis]VTS05095.1 Uncharacterized protein OS=Chroococcidiopsis thermalis PCC 7203 GN=Chro_5069 PE=4 SV=1 [Tuwongella immobilis]